MNATEPTVHIVDDDALFLAAVSRLLRASGFAVRTFGSASDFLAQRAEDAPGCVLADVRMPGMNGLELQSALALSSNPLPILFLTGHGDIPSSVRAMREGAEDFLEKRAPKAQLLEGVKRALARDVREREARNRQRELRARFGKLDRTGARSTRACRAGQAQQADRRRPRHPRADREAPPHGDYDEAERAVGRRTHPADRRGGPAHRVEADLP